MAEKEKKRKHSIIGNMVFYTASLAAAVLLLCLLVKTVRPSLLFFPSLLGYTFPLWVVLNIGLAVIYLCLKQLRGLVFLAAVVLCWGSVQQTFQIRGKGEERLWREDDSCFKVLTYNVHLFNYYKDIDEGQKELKPQLLSFIADEDADIVCMQEYLEEKSPRYPASEAMKRAGYLYKTDIPFGQKYYFGNRIYSKFPIVKQGLVEGLTSENAVYADIVTGRDTVRVYNIHLASFLFDKHDEKFLSSLRTSIKEDTYKEGSMRMARKIKRATVKRERQLNAVLAHADSTRGGARIVLCGDMNEQPVSYNYAQVRRKGFGDAFVKAGKGFGQSYQGNFPSFRIDYVFYRGGLEPTAFKTCKADYSDHRPVTVVFKRICE